MSEIKVPDKLTFRRKEVMQLTKLDGRVLDYWEKEFAVFSPVVNKSDEKFYSRRDVEIILTIKQWLIQEKLDKSSIKELLLQDFGEISKSKAKENNNPNSPEKLIKIRHGLNEILTLLAKDDKN
jgi:DNA-binding transcriptional MerR regulator